MMGKYLKKLAWMFAGCAASSSVCGSVQAAGLNSENYRPALDNQSSVMWETAKSIPQRSLLWAYTFSYALRPVEFGDGKDVRLRLNDHIQMNHLGLGFGLLPWLDVGASLPFALYSAPTNAGGYLDSVGEKRNFFFLADASARLKASFFPQKRGDGFYAAAVLGASFPTGSSKALLSDGTTRLSAELPLHITLADETWEFFLTPGAAFWGDKDRITTTNPATGVVTPLLEKSESLLLNTGARFWLTGNGRKAGSLQIEGGIRGDFNKFKVSLNDRASPVEWSGGAALWLTNALSVHGGYGTGMASAATAPLSRLVAGVRYLDPTGDEPKTSEEKPVQQEQLTSESYTDNDLNKIFEEAQSESEPPRLADEETMLRLMTQTEVIDIGAIRFEFDSSRLTADAKQTVARLNDTLLRLKPKSIKIDGHTDSVGSYKYNLPLSKRRADSVRNELVRLGQNPNIVRTEGFAFKYPLVSNATKQGRAQNRRIEVALDGKSFRKQTYTREEIEMFRRWIYPNNGKQPKISD